MSDDSNHLAKNVAGGIALVFGVSLLFKFVRRFWWAILLVFAISKISYWLSDEPKRDAVIATFERDKVAISDVLPLHVDGQTSAAEYPPDARGVTAIRATITNGASAHIMNLQLDCKYKTTPDIRREPQTEAGHAVTQRAFGAIAPGETRTVTFESPDDGGVRFFADPTTFKCEPVYEVQAPDLFKARQREDLDLLTRLDPTLETKVEGPLAGGTNYRVALSGVVRNDTDRKLTRLDARCHLEVKYQIYEDAKVSIELDVPPGAAQRYSGKTDLYETGTFQNGFLNQRCYLTRLR